MEGDRRVEERKCKDTKDRKRGRMKRDNERQR
jgi:hypothetical protein